jgi:hypothetical protein
MPYRSLVPLRHRKIGIDRVRAVRVSSGKEALGRKRTDRKDKKYVLEITAQAKNRAFQGSVFLYRVYFRTL